MRAAGVGADVATDGTGGLAGGIGRIKQTSTLYGVCHGCVDAAGLDQYAAIGVIDFHNFRHAREGNHDTAIHCENSATEACACAARNDWNFVLSAKLHNCRDLFSGLRQNHDRGEMLLKRVSVAFIDEQLVRLGDDGLGAKQ